jgi:TPP-dependent pyruvate/acetoin dehydrogenase alpha subunit
VQKLPLIAIVEFNHWAYSTPYEKQCAAKTLADKAIGYGIPGEVVDGNDVLAVYEVTKRPWIAPAQGAPRSSRPDLRLKGMPSDPQAYVDRPAEECGSAARSPLRRLEAAGLLGRPAARRSSRACRTKWTPRRVRGGVAV